ncbi:MAG: hypothetical protein FWE32_01420 [Oscillospiraceae bacterium]|nr:hypothetical protein [Oscillospiraceae bacterium]
MDKKYSVDDILLDIKSKKMRRQEEEAGGAPPERPLGEKFPDSGAGGKNGVAFAPDLRPPQTERLRPIKPPDEKQPPPITGEGEVTVLSPPPAESPPARPKAARDTGPVRIEDLKRPVKPERPVPPEIRNPLDFGSRVRPIRDKAKMRGQKEKALTELSKPAKPEPEKPGGQTSVIDFSKFRQSGESPPLGETREMPRLGPSREFDIEEIRNIDFGDAADEAGYDDYDYDEEELDYENEPHKSSVDFSEYNSIEDRRDVAIDIARTKLWLVIRATLTFALTGALVYLILCGRYMLPMPAFIAPEVDLRMYLLSITLLSVGVALVGSSAMGGGLISFFKLRANSDSLAALAMLGAAGQCVYALLNPENVRIESLTFYAALASASMLFNALGKLSMISRIQQNFKIISSDKPKRAVIIATDEGFTREYLKGATRRPSIAYTAQCDFFTDFLSLSFSDKYDVGINKAVAPVCLAGAAVVGVLAYILTQGSSITAVSAMTAILCLSATFSATFIENVPLGKLTQKLAPRGGMVSGNKAVEDFCDISALVLDEKDLFPQGFVEVHGIKAYSNGRVDEAILDAASIAYAMNSALSGVFLQMIGSNKKLLRKVDNPTFENGKGITAWIDGRRVMLGNRNLMKAHDIPLPDPGFEKKYANEQGEPLFLSSSGELAAQLVVGYRADEELAIELDRLGAAQKLLIVHTLDSNLTPHKIWEIYGYPEELVQIMPAHQHEHFEKMTAPRNSELAEIAYTGRASAMVGAILACMSARSSILSATAVQLLQITLGYGLVALLAFLGAIDTLTILALGGYQIFWFIVIWLIQRLKAA